MVDPDNRRPVDYAARKDLLRSSITGADLGELLQNWHNGAIKLRLVSDLLRLRHQHPDLFNIGSYEAISVTGPAADRVCAFRREHGPAALVVAAAIYPTRGRDGLESSAVPLPSASPVDWVDLFSGRKLALHDGAIAAADLFAALPVAALIPAAMFPSGNG